MTYSVLALEREGYVATLWLDRAEKRNAMGAAFFAELPQAMGELSADRAVRAVVVAARGPHFSVGLDLNSLSSIGTAEPTGDSEPSTAETARRTHEDVLRLQAAISSAADCPKPVIAAVHGYCIGGGVDLITSCDIRVCSADAVFSVRETKMAIVADVGTLARLPLILSTGHVAEIVYTGKDIGAARAAEIGLVNHVFATFEETLAGARGIAAEIAANSPLAVEGTKAVLSQAHRAQVDTAQRYVAAWNAGQLRSHDLTEALTAFFEKRQPDFQGR